MCQHVPGVLRLSCGQSMVLAVATEHLMHVFACLFQSQASCIWVFAYTFYWCISCVWIFALHFIHALLSICMGDTKL